MKTTLTLLFALVINSVTAQDWHTDFEEAKLLSQKENKKTILVFQGSDWCAACIKLENEVWKTEEFKKYASEHFVLVKAEFPRKKKNALPSEQQEKNNKLAAKYNTKGYFPLVVLFNKNGKVIGETGYKKLSPSEYIKLLESFN